MMIFIQYLQNEVNVKITCKLMRSSNSFCLMADNAFKVKIDSVIVFENKLENVGQCPK